MPWRNPVLAGSVLIRPAIKSPNYVPGVSGWSINRDGSAELNDLTVRFTSGLTIEENITIINDGSATFSIRNLYYTRFGQLVWGNISIVVATAGSGNINVGINPIVFAFENEAPNGDPLSQPMIMTYSGCSGAAGGAPALTNTTGVGAALTASGNITQLRCANGQFIKAGNLVNGSVITVQFYSLINM